MIQPTKKKKAFTLIEILAATGIMAVVILVALGMTTNVLTAWNRGAGKLTSNFEARVALDMLTRDLESLIVTNKVINTLEVRWEEPEIPGRLNYDGALPPMPKIYFLAPVVDRPRFNSDGENLAGDICAVAYQVAYQNPFTGNIDEQFPTPMFALYRFVIDPESTFQQVMTIGFTPSTQPREDWLSQRMGAAGVTYIDETGNRVGLQSGNIDDEITMSPSFLSANVVDFQLEFYFSNSENREDPPQRIPELGGQEGDSFVIANRVYINGRLRPTLKLEFIDVKITVMSDEGLGVIESGVVGDTDTWQDLVAQYGSTFSRRVHVMSQAQ